MPDNYIEIPGFSRSGETLNGLAKKVLDLVKSSREHGISVDEITRQLELSLLGWERHKITSNDLTWVIVFLLSKDKANEITTEGEGKEGNVRVFAKGRN